MKNKQTILVLEQFLIDNGVDPDYYKELCLKAESIYLLQYIFENKKILEDLQRENKLKISEIFIEAFTFSGTKEGYEFWEDLNTKWRELCINFQGDIYLGFNTDINLKELNEGVVLYRSTNTDETEHKEFNEIKNNKSQNHKEKQEESYEISEEPETVINDSLELSYMDLQDVIKAPINYKDNKLKVIIEPNLKNKLSFLLDLKLFDAINFNFDSNLQDSVLIRNEYKNPTDEVFFENILNFDYISKVDVFKKIKDKKYLPETHFIPMNSGYPYLLYLYDKFKGNRDFVFKPYDLANSEGVFVGTLSDLDKLKEEMCAENIKEILKKFNIHYAEDCVTDILNSYTKNNYVIQERLSINKEYRVLIFKVTDEIVIEERKGYSKFITDNSVKKEHNVINITDVDSDVLEVIEKIRVEETDLFNQDLPVLAIDLVKTIENEVYLIEANSGFGIDYPIDVLNRIQTLTSASLYRVILDKFNIGSEGVFRDYCIKNFINI